MADKIDFTTFDSGVVSSASGAAVYFYKSNYALESTSDWHGVDYNTVTNSLGSLATVDKGSYAAGAKGGPITLSSTFPEGLYLLCWDFQSDTVESSAHIPFRVRIERDGATVFTSGDITAAAGAGSGSMTVAFWLKPGDVIYSQIFWEADIAISFRQWFYLSRIFSLSS